MLVSGRHAPNKTMGLLGVFNKDPSDDLTPANGGAPLNTNTSSEKTIYFQFGETCKSFSDLALHVCEVHSEVIEVG